MRPPCMPDCTGRKPGCHDHCEAFQAFRAEREKVYEERARYREIEFARQDAMRKWADIGKAKKAKGNGGWHE